MADQKKTETTQTIKGGCSTDRIMFELWERVSPDLSPDELRRFTQASENAATMTSNLQEVVGGISCLVNEDGGKGKLRAGNFQSSRDVPQLLFSICEQLETIEGLIHIGDSASYFLHNPRPKTISRGES